MAIVSNDQLIKVLRKYNSWWHNPSSVIEESKSQKRLAYFEAIKVIKHKTLRRFIVLSGLRFVGKTTIMYQMIDNLLDEGICPKNILYVSFDNPIVKFVDIEAVISTYEALFSTEGIQYIFMDEIQYTTQWELWMKVIYDNRKDIRLTATNSASPILEKGATDSGTGRWSVLKIPTMSFYEYCCLLQLQEPLLPNKLKLTKLVQMSNVELGDLMDRFTSLERHFHRYVTIGGFPKLILSNDEENIQRMILEDVVDKVLKHDILTLFNIRSPLLLEKLFLYLCMNSTEIFNITAIAKELENTSIKTIGSYIEVLERSNLIYLAKPMDVGSKGSIREKPKIFIADAAISNAVLMIDDGVADEKELCNMVETCVYKQITSFYQGSTAQMGYFRKVNDYQKEVDVIVELPREKIFCEVQYRSNSNISASDAIVELCKDKKSKVTNAFLITKKIDDFGISKHKTNVPIMRIPAMVFLYLLGRIEADGQNGKM